MATIHVDEPVTEETEAETQVPEAAPPPHEIHHTPPVSHHPAHRYNLFGYKKPFVILAIAVLIILAIIFGGLLKERHTLKNKVNTLSSPKTSQANDADEAQQLKNEIGQYLELPADEMPTVATVADASKVKGQSFFVNAQNGDKVLLFSKSGKAILYRPSTKKIVEVAPINLNQNPATSTQPTPVPAKNTR